MRSDDEKTIHELRDMLGNSMAIRERIEGEKLVRKVVEEEEEGRGGKRRRREEEEGRRKRREGWVGVESQLFTAYCLLSGRHCWTE